ncbi:MAG: DMT family transporter [Pseudomonadota bacterium]
MTSATHAKRGKSASQTNATVLGTIGMVMFAGTLPATQLALEGFGPVFITASRAVLAAALAGIALAAFRVPRPKGADLRRLGMIALCLVVGFPFFIGMAMTTVGAGHGGVVLAVMPLATAVAGALVGGERPGLLFWFLAALGGAVVLLFTLSAAKGALTAGDLFLMVAAVVAAFGYAYSGLLSRSVPGWSVIAWALVLSLPLTLAVTVLSAPPTLPTSVVAWTGLIYLGAISMFLGFAFWNVAMAMGGIAKTGQIQLLQPFVTIAMAAAVTTETIELRQVVFAAAVVIIVAAAQRARVARPPAKAKKL